MEEMLYEKKITSKTVFKGKILTVYFDEVILPDGKITTREKVGHPGAVAIVPLTANGEIIMVKQFRYPVEKILMEIPAGKLDSGEPAIECARRELQEEAGVVGGQLIHLTTIYTTPGFSDEKMDIFLSKGFKEINNSPDHDEFLHIAKVKISECLRMVYEGLIMDAKSIIGIMLARDYIMKNDYEAIK
jgi:ADP-ribose pyrophosphatase